MSEKNIGSLLIESRYSKLGAKTYETRKYGEEEERLRADNEQCSNQDEEMDGYFKEKMLQKDEQLRRAEEEINNYKRREKKWHMAEGMLKQQISHLRNSIMSLYEEIQLLKHNHQNEIEFYLRKEKQVLTTISTLLETKQVQRMEIYLQHSLSHLHSQSKCTLPPSSIDPSFLSHFLAQTIQNMKLMEIGIGEVRKLPQIQKLMRQEQITSKKFDWYLAQVPFEERNKKRRSKICEYFLKKKRMSGKQILELIIHLIQNSGLNQENQENKEPNTISELIEQNSLFSYR